ncbi:MAG: IS21-like element helper ATPase IstB [Euryarchaeota archaeon]|nr:IS21-like element helper ATPase IstB [Euryarchaeota archaeon]
MTKIEKLKELLLTLRLKAMAEILEETLKETQTDNLSPVDILTLLASQEIAQRQERLVKTRINQAQFPVIKTLDAFDFSFPKSINKSLILNLFDLHFIEEKGNVIIMGPPGTGKTHMALALGYQASLQGIKTRFTTAINLINLLSASLADNSFLKAMKSFTSPRALIIDELGYLPVDKQGAELLFQVISSRYECGSIIITTNRAFRDWGKILNNDNTLASATIDRLVHHGTLVQIKGDSYRVK